MLLIAPKISMAKSPKLRFEDTWMNTLLEQLHTGKKANQVNNQTCPTLAPDRLVRKSRSRPETDRFQFESVRSRLVPIAGLRVRRRVGAVPVRPADDGPRSGTVQGRRPRSDECLQHPRMSKWGFDIFLLYKKIPTYSLVGFDLTTYSSYLLGRRRRWYH
jgi:hypothetical protein